MKFDPDDIKIEIVPEEHPDTSYLNQDEFSLIQVYLRL